MLEHREDLKLRQRVPYSTNMQSVFWAMLAAYGFMSKEEPKEFADERFIRKEWLMDFTQNIIDEFNRGIENNRRKN